jgi:putative ABC transport system permease protein
MTVLPILAALKRHKAGTVLIALQIALTLAIVCNALFIIQQRVAHVVRPSGVMESELLTVQNRWVGVDDASSEALTRGDLVALRGLAGVADASYSNSYPLRGGGMSLGIKLNPEARKSMTQAAIYFSDDHSLNTLGAKLIAGRNFRPDEITWITENAFDAPAQVIITKALADKVFPHGTALGKTIYLLDTPKPSTIIGVVERLQVPWSGTWADKFVEHSVLVPFQAVSTSGSYLIRSKPGQLAAITQSVPAMLFKLNRMRVIPPERGVRTFAQVRERSYKSDRGMALLMGVICVVLLAITAAGIVGLTSFWVGQRRKQIGVRRALGATRHDILSYFLTENLLIGAGGVAVGAVLAVGLNLWMVSQFEMSRFPLTYVAGGVAALLALGQAAVLAPALRASRVSPVEATRSV